MFAGSKFEFSVFTQHQLIQFKIDFKLTKKIEIALGVQNYP